MSDVEKGFLVEDPLTLIQKEEASLVNEKQSKHREEHFNHWSPDQGAHQVYVEIDIEQLERIDTANQTFRSAFTVTQSWLWSKEDKDSYQLSSLEHEKMDANYSSQEFEFSWQPSALKFQNAIKESLEVIEDKPYLKKYNQLMVVEMKTHVYGDFGEKFELDSYPFDCQDFRISITWCDSEEVCNVSPNPFRHSFVSLNLESMIQRSFEIFEPIVQVHMKPRKEVSKELKNVIRYNPTMQIYLKGRRFWGPYLWQIYLMMIMMSTSSLFVFTLDMDSAGDKLAAISTIFLTKIAFQTALSTILPILSYRTITDNYIVCCMIFSFSIMIQTSICSMIQTYDITEINLDVSKYLLIVNTSLLLVGNLFFFIYIYLMVVPKENLKLVSCDWYKHDGKGKVGNTRFSNNIISNKVLGEVAQFSSSKLEIKLVVGWLAIKMPGYGNFAFFGEQTVTSIIDKYYDMYLHGLSEKSTVPNISRYDYQKYCRQFCGLWTVDMGDSNGTQFLAPFITVGDKSPVHTLMKITGDSNLPSGKLCIMTKGLPILAHSTVIKGYQQNRRDGKKSVGIGGTSFGWSKVEITSPDKNTFADYTITILRIREIRESY